MPHHVIEHEQAGAGPLEQRSHDPEIRAAAGRLRRAVRNQVAGRDRQQEDAVQIGMDRRGRKRDGEEFRE
jgi:hypothetical protein